jgi:hypothetical protein
MAVNRTLAIKSDLAGYWRGALSDDYQMTTMCRAAGLRVYFVPQCMVGSPVDFDRRSFFNFARRQYIITRTHAPKLYLRAAGIMLLHVGGWLSAWMVLVIAVTINQLSAVIFPGSIITAVFISNQLRSTYRRQCIHNSFAGAMDQQLRATLRIDRWMTAVWMAVHLGVILSTLLARTITWRGRCYRIDGVQKITQLDSPGKCVEPPSRQGRQEKSEKGSEV